MISVDHDQPGFNFGVEFRVTRWIFEHDIDDFLKLCIPICPNTTKQLDLIEIQKDEAESIETSDTSLQTTASCQSEQAKTT